MDKKKPFSFLLARWRGLVQACAALLTNLHLPNFLTGTLYRGAGKTVCVPGLNCYSCPGAAGACPIGSFQAVVGSSKFSFSYYITGILILLGVLLGRFICGFLCPFGWFQELLHKIPSPKLSTKRLKPLRYVKYAVLLIMVVLLPVLVTNELGMGDPFFCKYLCPQGVLEGALPLAAVNSGVLGTVLVERTQSFTLEQSMGFGLGSGLGYLLAVMLVTEADRRLRSEAIPEAFRGLPSTLIYIGVLALAIYGFTGHSVIL